MSSSLRSWSAAVCTAGIPGRTLGWLVGTRKAAQELRPEAVEVAPEALEGMAASPAEAGQVAKLEREARAVVYWSPARVRIRS